MARSQSVPDEPFDSSTKDGWSDTRDPNADELMFAVTMQDQSVVDRVVWLAYSEEVRVYTKNAHKTLASIDCSRSDVTISESSEYIVEIDVAVN